MLNPVLVGQWDANHLWLQWDDIAPDQGYAIEVQYKPLFSEWGDWMRMEWQAPYRRCWLKWPTHKAGLLARARVGIVGGAMEPAVAGRFTRSRCLFEFSGDRKVTFRAGDTFHLQVDGEYCEYRLAKDVSVDGGPVLEAMESTQSSGFAQLDHAGHFSIEPMNGVRVRNTGPSVEDLARFPEQDFVTVEQASVDGPVGIAFQRSGRL